MPADGAARLFVAVPIDSATRAALADRLATAGPLPGRVVPPVNWHLTLRFLGDTTPDAEHRLCRALDAAAWPPAFPIRFGPLGAFPTPQRARVLWLGVATGAAELAALAAVVDGAVGEPGPSPFAAHLTLARLRPGDPADVRALVARVGSAAVRCDIDSVAVVASELGHGPPRYEVRHTVALRSGADRTEAGRGAGVDGAGAHG